MSGSDELERIRQKRLRELQQQAAQAQAQRDAQQSYREMQQQQIEQQKRLIMGKILSSDARVRLTNIKMSRPQFGELIENQLIALYQRGAFGNNLPLSDEQLKEILKKIQEQTKRPGGTITFR